MGNLKLCRKQKRKDTVSWNQMTFPFNMGKVMCVRTLSFSKTRMGSIGLETDTERAERPVPEQAYSSPTNPLPLLLFPVVALRALVVAILYKGIGLWLGVEQMG